LFLSLTFTLPSTGSSQILEVSSSIWEAEHYLLSTSRKSLLDFQEDRRSRSQATYRAWIYESRQGYQYSPLLSLDGFIPHRKLLLDRPRPSSCHHGARWPFKQRLSTWEATQAAMSYISSYIRLHAPSLKVQTSKGNYLTTLSVRTENLKVDFAGGNTEKEHGRLDPQVCYLGG
jgi:hypothetical protein